MCGDTEREPGTERGVTKLTGKRTSNGQKGTAAAAVRYDDAYFLHTVIYTVCV